MKKLDAIVILFTVLPVVAFSQSNLIQNPSFDLIYPDKVIYFDQLGLHSGVCNRKFLPEQGYFKHWRLSLPTGNKEISASFFPNESDSLLIYSKKRRRLKNVAIVIEQTVLHPKESEITRHPTNNFYCNELFKKVKKNRLYCFEARVRGLDALSIDNFGLMVTKKNSPECIVKELAKSESNIATLVNLGRAVESDKWETYRTVVSWNSSGSFLTPMSLKTEQNVYVNVIDSTNLSGRYPSDDSCYPIIWHPEYASESMCYVRFAMDDLKLTMIDDSSQCPSLTYDHIETDKRILKDSRLLMKRYFALRFSEFYFKEEGISQSQIVQAFVDKIQKTIFNSTDYKDRYAEIIMDDWTLGEEEIKRIREALLEVGYSSEHIDVLYKNPYKNYPWMILSQHNKTIHGKIDFKSQQGWIGLVEIVPLNFEAGSGNE